MDGCCYISCSNKDIYFANGIKDHLRNGHYDVIISSNTCLQFHYQTSRGQILDSKFFIAIVTSEFINQQIHLYELALALDLGKKTVIIQHELARIPDPFPELQSIQWNDDVTILSENVCHVLQDPVYEFPVYIDSLDGDAFKRYIWKFEETQIAKQLSPHVRSGEYASTELQLKDIQTTLITLCEGINKIQSSPVRKRKVSKQQFPRDIRRVARRYQDVIAYPIIRQLGRYLDLEDDELDEVERFSEYGTKEVFWQTIRLWLEKTESKELTVGTIIKALRECDVDLKGKQMSNVHKKILKSKMPFLVDNLQLEPMLPSLVSQNILCEVTKAYVTAPRTVDQKVNRLVDVLTTKEDGLSSFCHVLQESGYKFVADEIKAFPDHHQTPETPIAVLRPTSCSFSSTVSDSDSYVKHLIHEYRLSHSSSTSSVFSRRDSTSSTKTVAIAPLFVSLSSHTDKHINKKEANTSEAKSSEKSVFKNSSNFKMKGRKGKGKQTLSCINSCVLS
ncbi:uncharacterized protein LOC133185094 [Saccostrea echinata]|uniref:uncharacterized protein LOC133185094 n=1 Tax=Saccostrea echinata TaxID=191078 RepID=UPI002A81889B|nr:uncharacterized protein LOC133185094 [Saccostrea echinata]